MAVDIIARGMAANAASKGGDYENLTNLPQINGHELKGNLSSDSLGLQEAIQFEEMPEASADYLGKVYQYIGETETYKQGAFYICTTDGEEPPSFQWVELSSLDDYYTKEETEKKIDEKISEIPLPDMSNYYKKTETYNKTEADSKIDEKINAIPINNIIHYQGHLDSIDALPQTGQPSGDDIAPSKGINTSMYVFNTNRISVLNELRQKGYLYAIGNKVYSYSVYGRKTVGVASNYQEVFEGMYFQSHENTMYVSFEQIFLFINASEDKPAYVWGFTDLSVTVYYLDNTIEKITTDKLITSPCWVKLCIKSDKDDLNFCGNVVKPIKYMVAPFDTWDNISGFSNVVNKKYPTQKLNGYNYNIGMDMAKFNNDTKVLEFITADPSPLCVENNAYTVGDNYDLYVCDDKPRWNEWSKTDLSNYYTKEEVDTITNRIEAIAKGRATGYVFNTKADMDLWLEDEEHVAKLNMGDNLYIIDRDTPDYWWDGTQPQELETQKVDLSEYYKKSETDAKIDEKIAALDVYTKAQTDAKIDEKIAAIPTNTLLHYQGHVNSVDDLPSTGQESGVAIGTPVSINGTVKNKLALTSTPTSFVTTLNNKANELGMPYYIGYTGKGACNFGIFFKDVDSITGISCANIYETGVGSRYPMFIKVKASADNPIRIVSYGNESALYIACMDISNNSKLYRDYTYNGKGYTLTKDAIISFETTSSSSRASGSLVSNTGATFKYAAITTYWDADKNTLKDFGDNNKSAYHAYDTTKVYYTNDGMKFLSFNLETYTATIVQNDPSPLAKENAMYTVGDSYDIYVCDNRPHWNLWSEAKVKVDEDTINMNSDSELQSIGNILQSGGFQHYWKGNKVEYTAIEEKDPNTLYEILDDEETALFEVDGNTIEFSPDGLLRVPNNMDMMFQSVTYGNHESGYRKWRNGFIEQWGVATSGADGEVEFTMHQPHIDQNFSVFVEPREMGNFFHYAMPSANQKFKCRIQTRDSQNMAIKFQWHSYGYFK